jgi:hypothetical protein
MGEECALTVLSVVPVVEELDAPVKVQVRLDGSKAYRRSWSIVKPVRPLALPPAGAKPNSTLPETITVFALELVTVPKT